VHESREWLLNALQYHSTINAKLSSSAEIVLRDAGRTLPDFGPKQFWAKNWPGRNAQRKKNQLFDA
jgi:hypothetical protein